MSPKAAGPAPAHTIALARLLDTLRAWADPTNADPVACGWEREPFGQRGSVRNPDRDPDEVLSPAPTPPRAHPDPESLTEQEKAANRRKWWGLTDR